MKTIMSHADSQRLKDLERVVDQGQQTFFEVGSALKELREDKLYRETHKTFEAYVQERFGFKKSQAYNLIDASEVAGNVHHGGQIKNERQAREVAKAPPERQQEVVDKAAEMAEVTGKVITAKTMAEAREAVMSESPDSEEYEDVDDEQCELFDDDGNYQVAVDDERDDERDDDTEPVEVSRLSSLREALSMLEDYELIMVMGWIEDMLAEREDA
tara:strand:+ start:154 stop:798 length:645 start_codon:yes stop_codon:yes gene_type:complete